ncbi:substrate-binding domain-containing protein [Anaerocolumna jejuensis]|uniref:substrate-binding domain-containing protein n=1 Tax=Anaerocolumna jejuensis TaxID=259063 RepID=UPI003F7B3D9B
MENDLLSAQEVADILKISRNTVYELIKRGDLNSSKVGKQVRVTRNEVNTYLNGSAQKTISVMRDIPSTAALPKALKKQNTYQAVDENIRGNEFIICGQDISLDILANHLGAYSDTMQLYRSYLASYNGIYALYQGRVNIATAHLWDGDLDEYNASYIKKMMPGIPALTIRIGKRRQGFYVQKNNPKGINGWSDLKRRDITIVNRERGSGTRVLLDEKLRLMGMIGDYIEGYHHECKSHLAVASLVSHKEADLGIGSETGLMNVAGIDFIPLQTECYDLVMRLVDADKQPYKRIMEILASDEFKMDLQLLGCYDTQETGKIIWN